MVNRNESPGYQNRISAVIRKSRFEMGFDGMLPAIEVVKKKST